MMRKLLTTGAAYSAILVTAVGPALARDCGTDCDTSGRTGRCFEAGFSVSVYGGGGARAVRTWIPLLIDDGRALLNNSCVQIVNGEILGSVTSFDGASTSGEIDAVLGLWPCNIQNTNSTYTSNDAYIVEAGDFSDTLGKQLTDGRVAMRANFNSAASQNNLEVVQMSVGSYTNPELAAGSKVLTGAGVDGVAGSVFLSVPGAMRNSSNSNVWVGNSNFDAFTGNVPRAVNIWNYAGAAQSPTTPAYSYLQSTFETWASSNGAAIASGAGRQTQPVFARVQNVNYVLFGGNDSANGGSARPAIFTVDAFEDNNAFTGAVAILPPTGYLFVDHQANGGGSGPFENAHFDMNDNGQVVALIEQEVDPNATPSFAVVRYDPVISAGRITGYSAPVTLADAGPVDTIADGLAGPIIDPNAPDPVINAISAVSINNRGNVAFTATYDTGIPFDPNDPNSPTIWDTAAYLHYGASNELHQVLREKDIISYDDGGSPVEVSIGLLAQEDSDSFFAQNLADTADVLALNFRADRNPENPGGARGVAIVAVGHIGDVNFDGVVDITDLALLLASFGSTFETPNYNPQADLDLDGDVDISDLAVQLSVFGQSV